MPKCVVLAAGCAVFLAACATSRQPEIQSLELEPPAAQPAQNVLVTAKINDYYDVVHSVSGVVTEYNRAQPLFTLRDDGVPPDAKADDGVWTAKVPIDFRAPPGTWTLEFTAYNSAGDPVLVTTEEGETEALRVSETFEVVAPALPPAEEDAGDADAGDAPEIIEPQPE
jgi:hypothetical protein